MFYRIFRRKIVRRRSRRAPRRAPGRSDYLMRKDAARDLAIERLGFFTEEYAKLDPHFREALKYNRVAIRNTITRWGSCSSKKNLNFSFRILDLPPELRDYVIVHELCHLKELHHGKTFWDLMELVIPDAKKLHLHARRMKIG